MFVVGVGLDLIEVARIEESIQNLGSRFIKRIAHRRELEDAPSKPPRQAQYWAARFAAKEAFAKALGTGIGTTVKLSSVGIVKNNLGRPELCFSPKLQQTMKRRGIARSHVSLTHTAGMAAAVVVLEGKLTEAGESQ